MKISEVFLKVFLSNPRFASRLHSNLEAYNRKNILKNHFNIDAYFDIDVSDGLARFNLVKTPIVLVPYKRSPRELTYMARSSGVGYWSLIDGKLSVIEQTNLLQYLGVVMDGLTSRPSRFETFCGFVTNLIIMQDLFDLPNLIDNFDLKRYHQDFYWFTGIPKWEELIPYGFPTRADMSYVVWKKFLKDYMEHSQVLRYDVVSNYLGEHGWVHYTTALTDIRHHKFAAWEARWDYPTPIWKTKITDDQGVEHRIMVHSHELSPDWLTAFPEDVNIPPKVFLHEAYLETLALKRERLFQRQLFLTMSADDFGEWSTRIKPIIDSTSLIKEGAGMNHCIGGEQYINAGSFGENVYLRYAPKGIALDDLEQTFTITLSCLRKVERYLPPEFFHKEHLSNIEMAQIFSNAPDRLEVDQGIWFHLGTKEVSVEDATTFMLAEVWGSNNTTPDHFTMQDIYQMIYDNQDFLKDLAKQANTFQSTTMSH